MISRFGPPDQSSRVVNSTVEVKDGTEYYYYELSSPKTFLSSYVCRSQLYVLGVTTPLKSSKKLAFRLKSVRDSFRNDFCPID